MSRAERLLSLIELLRRHRRPVSGAVLSETLGISLRTLYRDIASLQAQGAAIDGAPGLGYVLQPGFMLPPLYVADAAASARFYTALLGHPAVEASPTFAMFALGPGAMLGLWRRDGVAPAPSGAPGASELAFPVGARAAVDERHAQWQALGCAILQPPTAMDFGYTFTAQDPDGHRLRVFVPAG